MEQNSDYNYVNLDYNKKILVKGISQSSNHVCRISTGILRRGQYKRDFNLRAHKRQCTQRNINQKRIKNYNIGELKFFCLFY